MSASRPMLPRLPIRRATAVFVAALLGIGAGTALVATRDERVLQSRQTRPGPGRDFMAIFDPEQPLMQSGTQVAVAELETAAAQIGYPLYRPSGNEPTQAWMDLDLAEVGLRYGDQIVLLYSKWPAASGDILARYTQMSESRGAGYVIDLGGNPAWVTPADSQSPGSPPVNVVRVTIENVEIALLGRIPMDELLAMATTLQA